MNLIKTNGYYLANLKGYNPDMAMNYNLFFSFCFNNNGIFGLAETEDEPYIPSIEEYKEFMSMTTLDAFSEIEIEDNKIRIRIYEPDTPKDFEENKVNPNHYTEWSGIITSDGLIMSLSKSFFSYAEGDYSVIQLAKGLIFNFQKI